MKVIKVDLKNNSYPIIVGSGILSKLAAYLGKLKIGNDLYVITNPLVKAKFGAILEKSLRGSGFTLRFYSVPDAEASKSLAQAEMILSDLSVYDHKKKIVIAALGGGVIGDLSGFVASIYKRGTPYIQLPTTLLAQVDSSIGGKTAVDLAAGKNLAGTFYQPKLVLSDIDLLKSLAPRQVSSALAEVIKYAVIMDSSLFVYLEKNISRILAKNKACLEFIVARCSGLKAGIVSRDELEISGLRTILNFGHTLGHAIEAAGEFKTYNHGEAVGLGMLCACSISRSLGLLKEKDHMRIEDLIVRAGLPARIQGLDLNAIIASHYHDKKFSASQNKFVLAGAIGKALIKRDIPLDLIRGALKERF